MKTMSKPFSLAVAGLLLALSAPIAHSAPLPAASSPIQITQNNAESPAMAAYNLGVAKYEANDLPAALAAFNESIRLDPTVAAAYVNRGNVKDDMGNPEGALEDYNYALSLDSNSHTTYFNRGLTYSRIKKYPEAIADFNKSLEIEPNFAPSYRARGVSKYESSQSRAMRMEGLADLRKAIELYRAQGDETNAAKTEEALKEMQATVDA